MEFVPRRIQARCTSDAQKAFCWGCYAMITGHEFIRGHRWQGAMRPRPYRRANMWVERGSSARSGGEAVESKGVAAMRQELPAVYEYLTLAKMPDGNERQVATLIVFIEDGRWKVCLSDRETDRTLWMSGDTLEDCLLSLDQAIQTGDANWRRSYKGKGKTYKKTS